MPKLTPLLRSSEGATTFEYGVMLALLAATVIVLVIALGQTPTRSAPSGARCSETPSLTDCS